MYTYLLETLLSILMGRYLEMELLDQMVIPYNSMYDHFLRNHHTDSQSSCTILHPPPQTHTPTPASQLPGSLSSGRLSLGLSLYLRFLWVTHTCPSHLSSSHWSLIKHSFHHLLTHVLLIAVAELGGAGPPQGPQDAPRPALSPCPSRILLSKRASASRIPAPVLAHPFSCPQSLPFLFLMSFMNSYWSLITRVINTQGKIDVISYK